MKRNQQRDGRDRIYAYRHGPTLGNSRTACIPGCSVNKHVMPGCFLFGFGAVIYSRALNPLNTLLVEHFPDTSAVCWWQGGWRHGHS